MGGKGGRPQTSRRPWDAGNSPVEGVVFVTPEQYRDTAPGIVHPSMIKAVVVQALADAADDHGELLDYDPSDFYLTHIARVVNPDGDDPPLAYDSFTAMTLIEVMLSLVHDDGLLAARGNGDSADYRLTLPGPSVEGLAGS